MLLYYLYYFLCMIGSILFGFCLSNLIQYKKQRRLEIKNKALQIKLNDCEYKQGYYLNLTKKLQKQITEMVNNTNYQHN